MDKTLFSRCLKPVILENSIHPCGQCPLCRRKKMLEWILRGTHELNSYRNKAIFLTLTYKPRYLPKEGVDGLPIQKKSDDDAQGNLRPNDMTLFFKRLRKYIERHLNGKKIKYIYCGEYGTLRHRPHYHAIIYGLEPSDITEETYKKLWGMGNTVLDTKPVTEYGIQYTVGYCSKKVLDSYSKKEYYYKKGRLPPYLRASKGIGRNWAKNHKDDFLRTGHISYKGIEVPIPRYYLKVLKRTEGLIIKWKTLIVERNTGAKKYYHSDYRFIPNPNGKYTNRIYELQREEIERTIKIMEEDTTDENYFETIAYYEEKLKQLDLQQLKAHKTWQIVNSFTPEQLSKICKNKRFKDDIFYSERTSNAKLHEYKGNLSIEYRIKEKEKARLKIYKMMNGTFGRRQKMEINQTLQNENI